jgi:hypothetical protein
VIKLNQKIAFKQTAWLLILASMLCVFFGNGVHVHAIFDHLFEHGDVHAFVHAHSGDQNHSHAKEFDNKEDHQHPIATVDLTGTHTQKTTSKASTNSDQFSSQGVLNSISISETPLPLFLDLPPPDNLFQFRYFSSYTLRGPPLG